MRLGQWLVVQSEEETELILKYRHEGNIWQKNTKKSIWN
jgi:hypothetical protein